MSAERKADLEAVFAELRFEIDLALKQGLIADAFHWSTPATGPDDAPWFASLTIIPRREPPMKKPASAKAIIDTIFDGLGDQGERDGHRFTIPSGYGAGGITIDTQDIAVALLERFDIAERDQVAG
jgi:hypothetical protein